MAFAARALGAVIVALVGVVAAELATGSETERTEHVEAPQIMLPVPPPAPEHKEQREVWVTTALARPLFDSDRRPPVATATVATVTPISLPRLTGTLVSPEGRRAVFKNGDKSAVMGEGSSIDDTWTVKTIGHGTVTVAGPDGSHVLHMTLAKDGPVQEVQTLQLSRSIGPARTHNRTEMAARK